MTGSRTDDAPITIPALLHELTGEYRDLAAVVDVTGTMTYGDLEERSGKLALALLDAGVSKGARVGILMPNGQDYFVALFAAFRIGAVAVLMSTLARPPELAQMIRTTEIDILLSADRYLRNDYVELLETALPGLSEVDPARRYFLCEAPFLRAIWIWGENVPGWARDVREVLATSAKNLALSPDYLRAAETEIVASDRALIIFTSGSSAEPKAVVHSHVNFTRQGKALATLMNGCGPGDRLVTTMPFFWIGGLGTAALPAFCSGTAILCPADSSNEATMKAVRDFDANRITHWPQQLIMMKEDPEFRALLTKMKPAYAHQYELFDLAPSELTPNALGMTETVGPHCMYPTAPLPEDKAGSFGLPVGGIEHRIVDPETGDELPIGEHGQLCLRGGSLMIGMHRKAHDEVFDELGFYHTDDIARLDEDGHLYFSGRGGDIVKISGANVSPVEVEGVIRKLGGVKAAFVVGLPLDDHGDTLAAAIVPSEGALLNPEGLRATLKEQLSSYKVPRHYILLQENELPMTASEKIYKPGLKTLLTERVRAGAERAA